MASRVEEFFAAIGRRGHEPVLARATGTIRFEIARGLCTEHWYASISEGDVTVSRDNIEADTVVRADREVFDRVVRGEDNMTAAILRGEVSVGGPSRWRSSSSGSFPVPRIPPSGGWLPAPDGTGGERRARQDTAGQHLRGQRRPGAGASIAAVSTLARSVPAGSDPHPPPRRRGLS